MNIYDTAKRLNMIVRIVTKEESNLIDNLRKERGFDITKQQDDKNGF